MSAEILTDSPLFDEEPHNCRPSLVHGRAHDVPLGTLWTCKCGKRWRVTHTHYGRVCGCGWERVA